MIIHLPDNAALQALVAGIAAGALFYFSLFSGGFLFFYSPLIPLLLAGFAHGRRGATLALTVAMLTLAFAANVPVALLFMLLLGAPAWLVADRTTLWRDEPEGRVWYPLGQVFSWISLYGALLFLFLSVYFTRGDSTLVTMLSSQLEREFSSLQPDIAVRAQKIILHMPYLLFAVTAWLWLVMLWCAGWFSHFALVGKVPALRPRFAVERFVPPFALLLSLLASAVLALWDAPNVAFIGKTCLLITLFAYFLSGLTWLHAASRRWPNRVWIISFVYMLVITMLWPAGIVAGIGLWQQFQVLKSTK